MRTPRAQSFAGFVKLKRAADLKCCADLRRLRASQVGIVAVSVQLLLAKAVETHQLGRAAMVQVSSMLAICSKVV